MLFPPCTPVQPLCISLFNCHYQNISAAPSPDLSAVVLLLILIFSASDQETDQRSAWPLQGSAYFSVGLFLISTEGGSSQWSNYLYILPSPCTQVSYPEYLQVTRAHTSSSDSAGRVSDISCIVYLQLLGPLYSLTQEQKHTTRQNASSWIRASKLFYIVSW